MLTLFEFAGRLKGVKWSGRDKLIALCPAHEDGSHSLSASTGDDGRLLTKCFTGCAAASIFEAAGLTWADVLPPRDEPFKQQAPSRETKTWTIKNAAGEVVAEHVRIDEGGKKSFRWGRNGKHNLDGLPVADIPLYRSEFVASTKGTAILTEGEKSADAVAALGLLGLGTACGAAATPSAAALEVLRGRDVVLWPDEDSAGQEHMERIAKALDGIAVSVRWIKIPSASPKADAADYTGTKDELRGYIQAQQVGPLVAFASRIKSALDTLDRLHVGDFSRYVSTGVGTLDQRLGGGFGRGQVTLIGAPSGSGKTSLVVQFAMSAQEHGLAVVVSPEMSPDELVTREIVRRSGRPKWMRAPWSSESERDIALVAHTQAAAELMAHPPNVVLYDALKVNMADVVDQIRRAAKRECVALVALDYAQQLAADGPEKARHLQVGDVAEHALLMAREFDCAVIVTSQVNVYRVGRDHEYSYRESANLEQRVQNALLFIVERDEQRRLIGAHFRARKVRDNALFHLPVAYHPATFRVEDAVQAEAVEETRDWTR